MKKIILILVLILLTTGCVKKEVIVTEYVDKPIYIPNALLTNCNITQPPNKEEFMKLNILGRQTALAKYITILLKDLKTCNIKIKAIRDWNKKQKKIYGQAIKREG